MKRRKRLRSYTCHGHKLRFSIRLIRGAKAACSVHGSPFGLAQRVGFNRLSRTEAGLQSAETYWVKAQFVPAFSIEEKLRAKQPPTTSQNSSQPPSRDFKAEKKKRTRSKKQGAQPGHEKRERQLVENPNTVIEAYVDNCKNCHLHLWDQVPVQVVRRQVTE